MERTAQAKPLSVSSQQDNRRSFPRIKIDSSVKLEPDSPANTAFQPLNARTENLSQGGLGISLDSKTELPSTLLVEFSIMNSTVQFKGEILWSKVFNGRYYCGVRFLEKDEHQESILKGFLYTKEEYRSQLLVTLPETEKKLFESVLPTPKIEFSFQPHSCKMYGVDLTIGCNHGCRYCHFSRLKEYEWKNKNYTGFPIPVDISPMFRLKELPKGVIYLSPSSDPFAPGASELAHELLSFLLPKGLIFAISTKNVIPEKTLNLLEQYSSQVEVAMGIANIDEKRNAALEPGCPSAKERLAFLPRLLRTGCDIDVRMDPLIPQIDDKEEILEKTVEAIAKTGVRTVTASYIFSFGKFLMELKKEPLLKESIKNITEKVYVEGGMALSVPIETANHTYNKLHSLCKSRGIKLLLCGCKEKRFAKSGYHMLCRNNC